MQMLIENKPIDYFTKWMEFQMEKKFNTDVLTEYYTKFMPKNKTVKQSVNEFTFSELMDFFEYVQKEASKSPLKF